MRKSFIDQIKNNRIKSIFLMTIFIGLLIFVSYIINLFYGSGGYGILFIGIAIAVGMSLLSYFKGDKMALAMVQAKEVKRKDNVLLHGIVEGLSLAGGIPKPEIYIIPDKGLNAFATGRNPENASIAVTQGLLETMNKRELEGVIAHELSHVRNYDMLFLTMSSILIGAITLITDIALRSLWFGGGRSRENKSPVVMIIFIVSVILAPIIAVMIQMAISRKREFMADASAVELTRYPRGLADALEKIKSHSQVQHKSKLAAIKALSPLYISSPFSGLSNLFSTHPPLEKRIRVLKNM